MNHKFKYIFDSKSRVLTKHYFGPITINDIESSWEYAFQNALIPKETIGFIVDYRNASLHIRIDEYTAISNFYKKHLEVFGDCKIGVLTEVPRDVVIPMLVQSEDEGYSSKPFSTLESAIEWVLS
ncbi:hypothetical protein [Plebeiibacterium sediminum]|uniref:Uncharacterized protein n=1 Tax=Plebeiibacterium sediminum TaxID=2992112 RepID=A0AAE3M1G7_9BACT|nr:hypothetical protein [Plebeiobacterium sediminum]MCW3785374.1 hypothetical protein [Plebeiobacterium sediminum]